MFWMLVILLFGLAVFGVLCYFGGGTTIDRDFRGVFFENSYRILTTEDDLPMLGTSLLLACAPRALELSFRTAMLDPLAL